MKAIIAALNSITNLLSELNNTSRLSYLDSKSFWTLDELILYTGFKRSYIYTLTSKKEIPCYQPKGKKLFFDRDQIFEWLKTYEGETYEKMIDNLFKE